MAFLPNIDMHVVLLPHLPTHYFSRKYVYLFRTLIPMHMPITRVELFFLLYHNFVLHVPSQKLFVLHSSALNTLHRLLSDHKLYPLLTPLLSNTHAPHISQIHHLQFAISCHTPFRTINILDVLYL